MGIVPQIDLLSSQDTYKQQKVKDKRISNSINPKLIRLENMIVFRNFTIA
jgi:hypothetical protein